MQVSFIYGQRYFLNIWCLIHEDKWYNGVMKDQVNKVNTTTKDISKEEYGARSKQSLLW